MGSWRNKVANYDLLQFTSKQETKTNANVINIWFFAIRQQIFQYQYQLYFVVPLSTTEDFGHHDISL